MDSGYRGFPQRTELRGSTSEAFGPPQNQKNRLENRWNAAGTVDGHYLLLVAGAEIVMYRLSFMDGEEDKTCHHVT